MSDLEQKLIGRGCDLLDDLVYEVSEELACRTNNSGLDAQIRFLRQQGWTDAQILQAARSQSATVS
ncbi:hypothetical protein A3709_19120 [Halioglobus sp. HI00S01]|nr:hypothetical protein A3709_19120 [Halioglobus sp. HI00S01]